MENAPDGKIVKTDVSIAKNYLQKDEITELNEIVTMYLDYVKLCAFTSSEMEKAKKEFDAQMSDI